MIDSDSSPGSSSPGGNLPAWTLRGGRAGAIGPLQGAGFSMPTLIEDDTLRVRNLAATTTGWPPTTNENRRRGE